jgi:hypothetical protein
MWIIGLWQVSMLLLVLVAAAVVFFVTRGRGAAGPPAAQPQHLPPQGSTSLADDLASLADLRDRGVLSQQEFEAQKAALLGSGS